MQKQLNASHNEIYFIKGNVYCRIHKGHAHYIELLIAITADFKFKIFLVYEENDSRFLIKIKIKTYYVTRFVIACSTMEKIVKTKTKSFNFTIHLCIILKVHKTLSYHRNSFP